jgi:predicted Zn-dependent protease with MMP-like domain
MHSTDRAAFEGLVDDAVAGLPRVFRERIDNLSFGVEERATAEDLRSMGVGGGRTLLGVYRGVPLPSRTAGYQLTMPDRIVVFQEPHQRIARDAAHLAELVTHTVRHEVAHHFGISDERLRELDAY